LRLCNEGKNPTTTLNTSQMNDLCHPPSPT